MRLQRTPPPTTVERLFLALLASPPLPAVTGPFPPAADASAWSRLLELALAHGLAGLLHARRGQGTWWAAAPAWLRARLREQAAAGALRHELFMTDLRAIAGALASRGIEPVLLKGPALNLLVYDDPAERHYCDLDLLIDRCQLSAASLVLGELGYLLDEERLPESFYRRHHFHLVFRHRRRDWARVELHWDLSVPGMDVAFAGAEVRGRARPIRWPGPPVLAPGPEDFLLHLCLHAATGAFSRLSQVRDVHAAATHPDRRPDPAVFWERATRARLRTPAIACLELGRLFGPHPELSSLRAAAPAPLRPGIAALLRPESIVRQRLLGSAAGNLAAAIQRRDRRRDRLAVLFRRLRPLAAELGMDGHPYRSGEDERGRLFSWRGLGLGARALAYCALARGGWEIPPAGDAARGPAVEPAASDPRAAATAGAAGGGRGAGRPA